MLCVVQSYPQVIHRLIHRPRLVELAGQAPEQAPMFHVEHCTNEKHSHLELELFRLRPEGAFAQPPRPVPACR